MKHGRLARAWQGERVGLVPACTCTRLVQQWPVAGPAYLPPGVPLPAAAQSRGRAHPAVHGCVPRPTRGGVESSKTDPML